MTLTPEQLDELKRKHGAAVARSSRRWVRGAPRDDGTAQVYSPSLGPLRKIVPIAETETETGELIADLFNAFPALEQLARFGLLAKAFCEEHGAKGAEAFDQASHAWQMRLNPTEARGHDAALKALRSLLEAARALDGKEQT